jgi:hypothetical protein
MALAAAAGVWDRKTLIRFGHAPSPDPVRVGKEECHEQQVA